METHGVHNFGSDPDAAVRARFHGHAEAHPFLARRSVLTLAPPYPKNVAAAWDYPGVMQAVTDGPPYALLMYYSMNNELVVTVAADTAAEAAAVADEIVRECEPLPELDAMVRVDFWSWKANAGATRRTRNIDTVRWSEVERNYAGEARELLAGTVDWSEPPGHGQLLVMHGPAGTGKTHAITAIADAWRKWCDVHYVVDPEAFFGNAEYMLSVLLEGTGESPPAFLYSAGSGDAPAQVSPAERWRLLVVEDAAELIRADAREETGQGLSRLLNLCDGLIGQGLRVLVLLTTNEDVGKLHPAITRSGRCALRVEVGKFDGDEGDEWLAAHGYKDGCPSSSVSLADLYALVRGDVPENSISTGFGPGR